ncbi:hypothetical protein [Maribellus maritimus]|uniref:hypothetical protein n=1 Tax=Maribellus maritimus TaxID=2870838 RepID=UPI001EEAC66D|nr:hypothetical protein [Maribellus maritimus]MCG6190099.1 hypothetical protein [Maribellus maritimus]
MGLTTTSFSTKDAKFVNQVSNNYDWKFNWMSADEKEEPINVNVKAENMKDLTMILFVPWQSFIPFFFRLGLPYDIRTLPGAPGFAHRFHEKNLILLLILANL